MTVSAFLPRSTRRLFWWNIAVASSVHLIGSCNCFGAITPQLAAQNAVVNQAIIDSVELFSQADFSNAQAALLSSNQSREGSIGWYSESSAKLVHVALCFRVKNSQSTALLVANLALATLLQAQTSSTFVTATAREKGDIFEQAAYVYEELLKDNSNAKLFYSKALLYNPKSSMAMNGLARISAYEAALERNRGNK